MNFTEKDIKICKKIYSRLSEKKFNKLLKKQDELNLSNNLRSTLQKIRQDGGSYKMISSMVGGNNYNFTNKEIIDEFNLQLKEYLNSITQHRRVLAGNCNLNYENQNEKCNQYNNKIDSILKTLKEYTNLDFENMSGVADENHQTNMVNILDNKDLSNAMQNLTKKLNSEISPEMREKTKKLIVGLFLNNFRKDVHINEILNYYNNSLNDKIMDLDNFRKNVTQKEMIAKLEKKKISPDNLNKLNEKIYKSYPIIYSKLPTVNPYQPVYLQQYQQIPIQKQYY